MENIFEFGIKVITKHQVIQLATKSLRSKLTGDRPV